MLSIIIPSYGRPDKIKGVLQNVILSTLTRDIEVLVVVERGQQMNEYMAATYDTPAKVIVNEGPKNYAGAVNTAYGAISSDSTHIFLGADDLNFHQDWDFFALQALKASSHLRVVGTNDLGNAQVLAGTHATHYLIDRRYIDEIGGVADGSKGQVLFEGYDHNYTDTEFIGTAKARAVFTPCLTSIVEHIHPAFGKAALDPTYEKGNLHLRDDSELYLSRIPLWNIER